MSREPVRYRSTRGQVSGAGFEEVLLGGLAPDGGLFIPESWPRFGIDELAALRGRPYADVVAFVAAPFAGDAFTADELGVLAHEAYRGFRHAEVAPLRPLHGHIGVLELYWGPTLSFKDYALQFLGRLFDATLTARGEKVTVVGATSGDTGSAAIEALRDKDSIEVVMLHPKGRVSDVQRLQMTTVGSANIHNVAVDGTFDDCQDLVKAMFADVEFRRDMRLSAVNSINWVRILAQMAYYVWAVLRLDALEAGAAFAVPTGNFGNVYSGYAARAVGLPVVNLIAANNRNNGLNRFFRSGTLVVEEVVPTQSPAMDIQVPSNLERLLYDMYEEDSAVLAREMVAFRQSGMLTVPSARLSAARTIFDSMWMSDDATLGYIGALWERTGFLADPHTAIGVAAAETAHVQPTVPIVAIATAHPAKFPDSVEAAVGFRPDLPDDYADLYDRPERCASLPADLALIQEYVRSVAG